MALPQKLPYDLLQTQWASQINPVLSNVLVQGLLLENIALQSGDNTINTLLSRKQQGWFIVDQNAACSIYRSKPFNTQTLTLNASAPCMINLWVF